MNGPYITTVITWGSGNNFQSFDLLYLGWRQDMRKGQDSRCFWFAVGFKNISVDFPCMLPSWYQSMSTWENVITGKDIWWIILYFTWWRFVWCGYQNKKSSIELKVQGGVCVKIVPAQRLKVQAFELPDKWGDLTLFCLQLVIISNISDWCSEVWQYCGGF